MRSIILFLIFCVAIPFALLRPHVGVYLWSWFGYMSPHRLTWGFTYGFPFAQLIAIATLAGLLFTRDRTPIPWNSLTITWALFIAWMNLDTLFALQPADAMIEWERTMKIQLFSMLTILLINTRKKLNVLVWIIAMSIGFYGFKGGLFSVRTGAEFRVWGPPGSFIEDNNSIGLAFTMTIPLIYFLAQTVKERWQRLSLLVLVMLTAIATLTTHSRGALLGLAAISLMWMRNQRKTGLAVIVLLIMVPVAYQYMPDNWKERMGTVKTYEEDTSAMGRLTAWQFAIELAAQRPIGAGFGAFTEENYRRYSPEVSAQVDQRDGRFQNAHSIYFSVLAEHGIPGIVLFLGLGYLTLRRAKQVEIAALQRGDDWSAKLASAVRISLIGYAVCGAFLNLAYFDLFYHLISITVILERLLAEEATAAAQTGPAADAAVAAAPARGRRLGLEPSSRSE